MGLMAKYILMDFKRNEDMLKEPETELYWTAFRVNRMQETDSPDY